MAVRWSDVKWKPEKCCIANSPISEARPRFTLGSLASAKMRRYVVLRSWERGLGSGMPMLNGVSVIGGEVLVEYEPLEL